jgi:hypothetical protein
MNPMEAFPEGGSLSRLPCLRNGDRYGASLRDGRRVAIQTGGLIEDVSRRPDYAANVPTGGRRRCPVRRDRWCFSRMCLPSGAYTTYCRGLAHEAELRSTPRSHRFRRVASAPDSKLMERYGRATFRPQANRGRSNVGDDRRHRA